jgi:hypothetical protein
MKYIRLFAVGLLLLFVGCATKYRGDGGFSELTRTYVPVIGVTRGYMIEMPTFSPERDLALSYSLAGMPLQNDSFTVELAIYIPKERLTPEAQRALDVTVPADHEIHVSLIDKRTKAVVAETTSKVNVLPPTDTIGFRQSPCIKRLLRVAVSTVPKNADLEIKMDYRTHGTPLQREMMILLVNDAPLA